MANPFLQPGRLLTATAVLFMLALGAAAFLNIEYSNLDEELKAERIQSESLFSKKVFLQKEIDVLKKHINKLEYTDKMSTAQIETLKKRLAAEEAALNDAALTEKELQSKISQISRIRDLADDQYASIRQRASRLEEENLHLQHQLSEFRQREEELNRQLAAAVRPKAAYFRIEALSGSKSKETNKARKTDRILVSFSWPEASRGKNVYLVLSGPDNQMIDMLSQAPVEINMNGTAHKIYPAANTQVSLSDTRQRLDVVLELKEKLPAGVYKADVYTDDFHLGGTEIRLL